MADLFEPLRDTRDQPLTPPLPAEEVRRRGDRLRRRRTALAAAGATLGAVVVVGGGLALGGGLPSASGPAPAPPASRAPDPAPRPTGDAGPTGDATAAPAPDGEWRTTIPAGFPLAEDLEKPTSTEEELAGPGRDVRVFDLPFEACDRSVDLGAPEDSLAVRHTAPEWYDGRVLQVYADDAAARQVLLELVRLYEFCEEDVFPGPPDTVVDATIRPVPHGEEGYLVTRTYSVDGMRVPGLELLHVVRVGNALLVANLSNEGGADDASVARQLGERDPVIGDVATAMCVFAEGGCAQDGPPLGPQGLGPVVLGMSAAQAEVNGAVLEDSHGEGCTTFGLFYEDGAASAVGFLNGDQGVSVLLVGRRGVATPEGVGVGATEQRVRAAYPDVEEVPMGLVVPVPGFADREYTFAFEDGRLVEMALRLTGQACVG